MDDGKTRTAIVVIDQTSIAEGVIDSAKATVTNIAAVPAENTIVVAQPHLLRVPTSWAWVARAAGMEPRPYTRRRER